MFLLERNALVTVSPRYSDVPSTLTQFRWGMHVGLPFPFPSRKCVSESVDIHERQFEFSIHNHLDRIAVVQNGQPHIPRFHLQDKHKPVRELPANSEVIGRDRLQSVAIYSEVFVHPTPNAAFQDADDKIKKCFEHLAEYLGACQKQAPYLASWLVYPVTFFDVGTVFHEVRCWCPHSNSWINYATIVAIGLARNLQKPLFFLCDDATPLPPIRQSTSQTNCWQKG